MRLFIRSSICVLQCTKRMLSSASKLSTVDLQMEKPINNVSKPRFNLQYFFKYESDFKRKFENFLNSKIKDKQWQEIRSEMLNCFELSELSVDSQIINLMDVYKQYNLIPEYIKFLEKNKYEMNLSVTGKYLNNFYELKKPLTKQEMEKIYKMYDGIRKEHSMLNADLASQCLMGLSVTTRWKDCFELLDMIKFSGSIGMSNYTAIICAAFRNNEPDLAWQYMYLSVPKIPLHPDVFLAHIEHSKKNFEGEELKKKLEEMFNFWKEFKILPVKNIILKYTDIYESFGYKSNSTRILKK